MANLSQISTNRTESVMHTFPMTETPTLDFAETQSITLEWKLSGLKHIYESTRGESKSKCIKSAVFGDPDNLWEIIFYPNSGPVTASNNAPNPPNTPSAGEMSSFYLSAVPTEEEKLSSVKGKWVRKGIWAFRFEVRVGGKGSDVIASKEAATHVFSSKTVNWGWQSFARRSSLYYNAPIIVRETDSFVITCTVSANPGPPAGNWLGFNITPSTWTIDPDTPGYTYAPKGFEATGAGWRGSSGSWQGVGGGNGAMGGERKMVPKGLIEAVARTFDKEIYADIEFVIPDRKPRVEGVQQADKGQSSSSIGMGGEAGRPTTDAGAQMFSTSPQDGVPGLGQTLGEASGPGPSRTGSDDRQAKSTKRIYANKEFLRRSEYFESMLEGGFSETASSPRLEEDYDMDDYDLPDDSDMEEECMSEDELTMTAPSDTRTASSDNGQPTASGSRNAPVARERSNAGPSKTKIVIRDAAYRTWFALIYYLYTDVIIFAPLSSSFIDKPDNRDTAGGSTARPAIAADNQVLKGIRGRKEWLDVWTSEMLSRNGNYQGPTPCSAKAIYRLADKLDLPALRQRAFQHIISELTVQNCPFEVFTNFTATYEQVRKVEIAFFLHHWNEIKDSNAMVNLWQQIRLGRFDAFTEIWPHIVSNLSFVPSAPSSD